MTVIAYKDGVMAGDSCWSDGKSKGYPGLIENIQNKLTILESGGLYGGAGAVEDRELVKALHLVRSPTQLPPARSLANMDGGVKSLVVLPDGTVWMIETGDEGFGLCPVQKAFCAVGSGAPIAIGAMAFGASAVEAVKIACEHNVYCRPPVTHIKLKG